VLAVLLVAPLAEATHAILLQFPEIMRLMSEHQPLAEVQQSFQGGAQVLAAAWPFFLVFVIVIPICEEVAFRGFVLGGLQRRFKPWKAIVLSAFLFALYHMNVFQFVPAFLMGVVLGLLAVRSRSIWPGVLLHAVYNSLPIGVLFLEPVLRGLGYTETSLPPSYVLRWVVCALCVPPALYLFWRLGRGLSHKQPSMEEAPLEPTVRSSLPNGVPPLVRAKTTAGGPAGS
jgi:sodium transport system permease protein